MRIPHVLIGTLALAGTALGTGELDWPAISSQTKPWSRWWWLGNIGTAQDFSAQMERYAAAGLGGLEITPIYGVRGEEKRFKTYLSREWMDTLDHVLAEGKRLGLGLDMSTGNAWPFGGPWVTPDFSARRVVAKKYTAKGGERFTESIVATDEPLVRVAGPRRVTVNELKDPIASNANLQDLAIDQVRFPRRIPLQALMAVSDRGEKIDLTSRVGADGRLDWTAPGGGAWTLYALFLGWHGKQVERAGPGGEGDVIDHFSSDALARYLKHFDDAYAGHHPERLRAYFNDSYEVDDASGESNWTAHFLEEFKKRRGYDLRDELPAFFGGDNPDKNARVMSDHRETVSDLLLEEYTRPWARWAAAHGAIIRNQAHGSPANILDLYAASDIPETEGTSVAGMKLASSAAHVTGRPLASSETATWLGEHWSATLADLKQRVDLMFLGGVNHQCYHGTAFSPPGEAWPGFHFYASMELDPSNSIWADFDVLNRYVARVQSFLQSGRPANDILLYYPIYDTWAQRNGTAVPAAMPHFGAGGPRSGNIMAAGQELLTRGYTFDWISDRLLAGVTYANGALHTGGNTYRVIVVPETKFMPLETFDRLYDLAEAGATIVIQKAPPADVPGFGRLYARRSEFQVHTEAFKRAATDAEGITTLEWNKGRLLVGENLDRLLARAGVRREVMVDKDIAFERRAHPDGLIYFLLNRSEKPFAGWVPVAAMAKTIAVFDPMTGARGVTFSRAAGGGSEAFVRLEPGHALILKTFAPSAPAEAYPWWAPQGAAQPCDGSWKVTFVSGGPSLPAAREAKELRSWTEFGGDGYTAFSGTATYAISLSRPTQQAEGWRLDLGKVGDSARVRLNGREIAALIEPPWRVDILAKELAAQNTLEIAVTNLTANRIADLDRRDPSWKKFYNTNYPARLGGNRGADGNFSAAKWTPRPSGLMGPVTLTALERVTP